MKIEYEATFTDIDKDDVRARLKNVGAMLERPEYLQKRIPFHLPQEKRSKSSWARVRDEGGKVTMSLSLMATKLKTKKNFVSLLITLIRPYNSLKILGASQNHTKKQNENCGNLMMWKSL